MNQIIQRQISQYVTKAILEKMDALDTINIGYECAQFAGGIINNNFGLKLDILNMVEGVINKKNDKYPKIIQDMIESFKHRDSEPNEVLHSPYNNKLVYEAAVISKEVYSIFKTKLAGGWQKSELQIEGVKYKDNTGLVSKLYEKENEDGSKKYIYALSGTDPLNINDIHSDIQQALTGHDEQYENALRNAKIISNHLGYSELIFVGHSLGGGEAAYCSMHTGRKAITFNPAGVKNKVGDATSGIINAYIMKNDPLNVTQDLGLSFIPQADGIRHYIEARQDITSINAHSIDSIIKSLSFDE